MGYDTYQLVMSLEEAEEALIKSKSSESYLVNIYDRSSYLRVDSGPQEVEQVYELLYEVITINQMISMIITRLKCSLAGEGPGGGGGGATGGRGATEQNTRLWRIRLRSASTDL